ncbi:hypothetical protein AALA79_07835 [Lachnospiraceae bacterium 64-25]
MYKPTESEKSHCVCIVKEVLGSENDFDCEKYVNDIFNIAYSIGGDYGDTTLRAIAEALLN